MGMHVPLLITCLNGSLETLLMTRNPISKAEGVVCIHGGKGYKEEEEEEEEDES